jgi:CheY-specific phosphatase CheX
MAEKFILCVGRLDGRMAAKAAYLKEQDFSVAQTQTYPETIVALNDMPKISAIVVDEEEAQGEANEFLTSIRRLNPRLPIVWMCEQGMPIISFSEFKPNTYLDWDGDGDEIHKEILGFLSTDYYPESVIQEMIAAGNMVMSVTFQLAVDIDRPILKLSQTLPGDITSIMLLSGVEIQAHIVVNGVTEHLGELASELGLTESETPTRDDAAMLASEFVNQIAGNFQKRFEKEGLSSQLTLPVTIFGKEQAARYATVKPSLSMGLHVQGGLITVEFGFTTVRKEAFSELEKERSKEGEVSFL